MLERFQQMTNAEFGMPKDCQSWAGKDSFKDRCQIEVVETFGLPQRGKGAEVAENKSNLCTLCFSAPLRLNRASHRLQQSHRSYVALPLMTR